MGRRGAGRRQRPAVHDDHAPRDLAADAPNTKWVADLTEHPTSQEEATIIAVPSGADAARRWGYTLSFPGPDSVTVLTSPAITKWFKTAAGSNRP